MQTAPATPESPLAGLGDAVSAAADLAARAAGTDLETAALNLVGQLLGAAGSIAEALAASPGSTDVATMAGLLYSGVMQARKALAFRESEAGVFAAARERGRDEGFAAGWAAHEAGRRAVPRQHPARTGKPALKAV